jgi:hypothetical protein
MSSDSLALPFGLGQPQSLANRLSTLPYSHPLPLLVLLLTPPIPRLGVIYLGTLAAAAIHKKKFFGRETIFLLILLPIWMLTELVRLRQRPVTNVVAVFIMAVTFIPILVAYYVTQGTERVEGAGK